jgi:hypothetical protein
MHAGSADEFKIKMYLGYNPNRMQTALLRIGYQRVAEYNRHATHQDVIYVHKDEKPCSA